MNIIDVVYFLSFLFILILLSPPLGKFIHQILEKNTLPGENFFFKLIGVNAQQEMSVFQYFKPFIWIHILGFFLLFFILILQGYLPLNPQHFPGLSWDLALNTTMSFVTNTNWQAYSGEASLSYFSQMFGLTVQNFLSATLGICVLAVIARSLMAKESNHVGNFWRDFIRLNIYVFLPLAFILAILLMSQGVIQNFSPYVQYKNFSDIDSVLPMGPAASQIAIKQLGTNGGGFFGMNSSHPFENPTPLSNFFQLLSILLIPSALIFTFGYWIKRKKHAYSLYLTVLCFFAIGLAVSYYSEVNFHPSFLSSVSIEGKEMRFSQGESILWSVATTAASNGSVNMMHSSLSPLSGLVALFNMLTGEVVYGGVGSGLYGLILYVIITVFLVGLMVGRSPEYLGKKIETKEVFWSSVALLAPSVFILVGTSLALNNPWGASSLSASGPHALSEMLYGFASTVGNNGSAFAGLNANTKVLNTLFAFNMFIGRFIVIYPIFKIAESLSLKKIVPESAGTFPTEGPLFTTLLIFIVFIVGALTFFPVLVLGPIAEHLLSLNGIFF